MKRMKKELKETKGNLKDIINETYVKEMYESTKYNNLDEWVDNYKPMFLIDVEGNIYNSYIQISKKNDPIDVRLDLENRVLEAVSKDEKISIPVSESTCTIIREDIVGRVNANIFFNFMNGIKKLEEIKRQDDEKRE